MQSTVLHEITFFSPPNLYSFEALISSKIISTCTTARTMVGTENKPLPCLPFSHKIKDDWGRCRWQQLWQQRAPPQSRCWKLWAVTTHCCLIRGKKASEKKSSASAGVPHTQKHTLMTFSAPRIGCCHLSGNYLSVRSADGPAKRRGVAHKDKNRGEKNKWRRHTDWEWPVWKHSLAPADAFLEAFNLEGIHVEAHGQTAQHSGALCDI